MSTRQFNEGRSIAKRCGWRRLAACLLVFGSPLTHASGDVITCSVVLQRGDGLIIELDAELAVTAAARAKGLMGRTTLTAGYGMLFDFGSARAVAMWMKDTPLALDILFLNAAGRVVQIERGTTPLSTALISTQQPVRYALEINAGEAADLGIDKTTRLRIDRLANCGGGRQSVKPRLRTGRPSNGLVLRRRWA